MQLSEAEWRLMRCIWHKHPASAREVLDAVEGETSWAYTTVKTMLSRLVDKGALKVRMRANTSLYEPALSQSKAQASAVHSLIDRAFDGAFGSFCHFLLEDKKLSPGERRQLIRLLREQAEGNK